MQLVDTHCHIHEAWKSVNGPDATAKLWSKAGSPTVALAKAGNPLADDIIARALDSNVTKMLCVGTTLPDSKMAIDFVAKRQNVWASIGLHPHEAKDYAGSVAKKKEFAALATKPKVVAVGECGLDYFYEHSSKKDQQKILRFQIELALQHDLPMVFHVRDAFEDFWPIFDSYKGIRGVVHSFSSDTKDLEQILSRGLYVGLNGIMTFTPTKKHFPLSAPALDGQNLLKPDNRNKKYADQVLKDSDSSIIDRKEQKMLSDRLAKHVKQLDAAKAVPLNRLLLETDAPFLTPQPFRGSICEPRHVQVTAKFLADLREQSLTEVAQATTANAHDLFCLKDLNNV